MKSPAERLKRFLTAQELTFSHAFEEVRYGRKTSHWMWFIFPQLAGLGFSEAARYYGLRDLEEAREYLEHEILGERLTRISSLLLTVAEDSTAREIFGSPDDLKLRSCMTLFSLVPGAPPLFQQVLDRYYNGRPDERTRQLAGQAL